MPKKRPTMLKVHNSIIPFSFLPLYENLQRRHTRARAHTHTHTHMRNFRHRYIKVLLQEKEKFFQEVSFERDSARQRAVDVANAAAEAITFGSLFMTAYSEQLDVLKVQESELQQSKVRKSVIAGVHIQCDVTNHELQKQLQQTCEALARTTPKEDDNWHMETFLFEMEERLENSSQALLSRVDSRATPENMEIRPVISVPLDPHTAKKLLKIATEAAALAEKVRLNKRQRNLRLSK